MARAREAIYLRDKGWVDGNIGPDGGLALRITTEGREEFERGGFRPIATGTSSYDHEYVALLELLQPVLRLLEATNSYRACLGDDGGIKGRLVRTSHLPHFIAAGTELVASWRSNEPAVIDEGVRNAFTQDSPGQIIEELERLDGDRTSEWDARVHELHETATRMDAAVRAALRNYQHGRHLAVPASVSPEQEFMIAAIDEARKSRTEPNKTPLYVGAVVVKGGQIIARGHRGQHKLGEHAEYTTLERNLERPGAAANATLYCTLEPCIVRNPPKSPCADWIQRHRISRVVIGVIDPNRRIRGGGVRMLRKAGIDVALFPHSLANELEAMNHAFEREHEEAAAAEELKVSESGDALVLVGHPPGPTLYLNEGREPAIVGLGLLAINMHHVVKTLGPEMNGAGRLDPPQRRASLWLPGQRP